MCVSIVRKKSVESNLFPPIPPLLLCLFLSLSGAKRKGIIFSEKPVVVQRRMTFQSRSVTTAA